MVKYETKPFTDLSSLPAAMYLPQGENVAPQGNERHLCSL